METSFKFTLRSADQNEEEWTLKIGDEVLAKLHDTLPATSLKNETKLNIVAGVYSDIHKTIDDIHGRADIVLRNYLLSIGAIISVYLGANGSVSMSLLYLVPVVALFGTTQVFLMMGATNSMRQQQESLLTSLDQFRRKKGNTIPIDDSLFHLHAAPEPRTLHDFRVILLGIIFVISAFLSCYIYSHPASFSPFSKQRLFESVVTVPESLNNASVLGNYFSQDGEKPLNLTCLVKSDYTMTCR